MLRLIACSMLLCVPVASREPTHELPNVIVILADDLGYGDPGHANEASKIPTPNLDRLAAEGMRLTDAHSPSSVCTPTRYGLLTGRYAWRTRLSKGVLVGTSRALMAPGRRTLASLFQERGYETACIGKWHLGFGDVEPVDFEKPLRPGPLDHGFDHFFGIPASLDMPPYVYVEGDRAVKPATEETPGSKSRRSGGEGFWRSGPIAPDFDHEGVLMRITHEASKWISERARVRKRFFCYVPLPAPHTPWLPTEPYRGSSEAGPYGDFVVQVDDCVAHILSSLKVYGIDDETLVIFTSDNGAHWTEGDIERYGHRANGALRGQKADIHEGGHRVPFLVRWPGEVPAGMARSELFSLTDLYATFASLLGHELLAGEGEDSCDQLDLFKGAQFEEPRRTSMVHHSHQGVFAIRGGKWKLITSLGSGGFTKPSSRDPEDGEAPGQLYDLHRDPGETTNLYLENPKKVAELSRLLESLQQRGRSR